MDGFNPYRQVRVAELLEDFRTLQYTIAQTPSTPVDLSDHYTKGWAVLRQCASDGRHILDCAADTRVPNPSGGPDEQQKAELLQVLLDVYSRRHMGQKIFLRQQTALRWVEMRAQILQGEKPTPAHKPALVALDQQLRYEIASTSDELIYANFQNSDISMGRYIGDDPSLLQVINWINTRIRE